jgi:2-polyprenyl-3-methyl-5-hydroxy-6-metoxy-1,4-benzoquinol methylase
MKCIVCDSSTSGGLSPWHSTCPSCRYEGASLRGVINKSKGHDAINEDDREKGLKALRLENFKAIAEYAARFAPPGARTLLDVGSAHGWFLEAARERFDVLGIEPDGAVGNRALARGLPVRHGYFPDSLKDGEKFDVIVFNDVIEHIPEIHAAIAACKERLNPAGILILNLPNSKGFFYRLSKLFARIGWHSPFNRLWQKDLPSPHVHYFNSRNLAALVARHGFELVDSAELPALRAAGLLARLRCISHVKPFTLYTQYLGILFAIPVLRAFPSDIVVCIFRSKEGHP